MGRSGGFLEGELHFQSGIAAEFDVGVYVSRHAGFQELNANMGRLVEFICEYGRARIGARRY